MCIRACVRARVCVNECTPTHALVSVNNEYTILITNSVVANAFTTSVEFLVAPFYNSVFNDGVV